MELSKSDSIEKATEKLKRLLNGLICKIFIFNTHSGGMYIPPACLRAIQEAVPLDKTTFLGCPTQVYHGYHQIGRNC